ncbi:MAG: response regulator [Candidatus Omnitrophica bacterium]|nr:response regulator [Candidatus Omnitrophota bacterium]
MAKRILIVDDDTDFVEACQNMLEAAGYEVECETAFENALDKIRETGPDLLLLDILMENKVIGFDIADAISRDEKLRHIPVIFLTGYFRRSNTAERDNESLKRRGNVLSIIDKPVKPNVLLEAIKQALETR